MMKKIMMGICVMSLLLLMTAPVEAGAFDRVKKMFKSKERVTLTGTVLNVDSDGPVFRTEDGDTFRLTGKQTESLRDKRGAEISVTGYRHGEKFDLRRFKILREPEPEPEPELETSSDDYSSDSSDNLSIGEERWSDTSEPEMETYVVESGDTLGKISRKFYGTAGSWGRIAEANNIKDPRKIKVGMKLDIPAK